MTPITYFILFILTLAMLGLDLKTTSSDQHISIRSALLWSLFWVALAFGFAIVIYFFWAELAPQSSYLPTQATLAFLTGFLLEKSLSVDNLFVFAIIFGQYAVPDEIRGRALLWGIIGALVLRAIMIFIGAGLIAQFHWILYFFAFFLIWTGYKIAFSHEEDEVSSLPERLMRRCFTLSDRYHGHALFVRENGKRIATPLVLVLATLAFMDLMFAMDSIPAIFAVTQEPFLVLSANVFALLGLRSLYFVLQGVMDKFCYLKPALSIIMVFIGVKMLLMDTAWAIPVWLSLSVLLAVMLIAIVASMIKQRSRSA